MTKFRWAVLGVLLTGCMQEEPTAELKLIEVEQVLQELSRSDVPPYVKLHLAARGRLSLQELTSIFASSPQAQQLSEIGVNGLSQREIDDYLAAYESLCDAHIDEFVWHFTLQNQRLQQRYRWWLNQVMIDIGNEEYVATEMARLRNEDKSRLAWHAIGLNDFVLSEFMVHQLATPASDLVAALETLEADETTWRTRGRRSSSSSVVGFMASGDESRAHIRWFDVVGSNNYNDSEKQRATQMLIEAYVDQDRLGELHDDMIAVLSNEGMNIELLGLVAGILIREGYLDYAQRFSEFLGERDQALYERKLIAYLAVHNDVADALNSEFGWADASAEERFLLLGELIKAYSETSYCDYRTEVNWAVFEEAPPMLASNTGLLHTAE